MDLICRFSNTHFSFTHFDNLFNSCCYRNVTFPVRRSLPCRSFCLSSYVLEGNIDKTGPLTRVLCPKSKEILISFGWKWNSQIPIVFLVSKVSAAPFRLYWSTVFSQALKRATFLGNLKNPMPELCLCFSYEALPCWGTPSISQSYH